MSSNLETRISRNIARQKENFKRQQKIISSFNEDFLNNDDIDDVPSPLFPNDNPTIVFPHAYFSHLFTARSGFIASGFRDTIFSS